MSYAPEIVAAVRILYKERQAETGSSYLTDSEYESIDEALVELGGAYGPGVVEWVPRTG